MPLLAVQPASRFDPSYACAAVEEYVKARNARAGTTNYAYERFWFKVAYGRRSNVDDLAAATAVVQHNFSKMTREAIDAIR